jgi:Domain of unknown function (DUF4158)
MKRQWENEELIEHWILGPWDLAQVGNKTGATRLGFAVLLKFFQREGRFLFFKNEVLLANKILKTYTRSVIIVTRHRPRM